MMNEAQYREYLKNLELVCEMSRLTILYSGQFSPELVAKARDTLRKTEAQMESLRQTYARYEKPTQAE